MHLWSKKTRHCDSDFQNCWKLGVFWIILNTMEHQIKNIFNGVVGWFVVAMAKKKKPEAGEKSGPNPYDSSWAAERAAFTLGSYSKISNVKSELPSISSSYPIDFQHSPKIDVISSVSFLGLPGVFFSKTNSPPWLRCSHLKPEASKTSAADMRCSTSGCAANTAMWKDPGPSPAATGSTNYSRTALPLQPDLTNVDQSLG